VSETVTEVPSVLALVGLLRQCLKSSDSAERRQLIRQFQRPIWDFAGVIGDDTIDGILGDAAHDLDFYEPRPDWRSEDRSFYDDLELDQRLRAILRDLGQPDDETT